MTRAGEGSTSPKDPKGTGKDAGSTPAQSTGIKLVTVSFDEAEGLEVDWEGCNEYEAWAFLSWACAMVEDTIHDDE